MQIAQIIGGYTLGGADLLRRAMGKKKAEEMAEHRGLIVEGAKARRATTPTSPTAVRPDGEVRGVRLQQVAHRRLRGRHLSHRVAEGALPAPSSWPRRCRPTWTTPTRSRSSSSPTPRTTGRGAAAGHQPVGLPLRAGVAQRSATGWAPSRAPARGGAGDPARRAGPGRSRTCSTSALRVDRGSSTAARSRRWCAAGAFDALDPDRAKPARQRRRRRWRRPSRPSPARRCTVRRIA
jgi:hypothetical protein